MIAFEHDIELIGERAFDARHNLTQHSFGGYIADSDVDSLADIMAAALAVGAFCAARHHTWDTIMRVDALDDS